MEKLNPQELSNCWSDSCEVAKMCGRCAVNSIVNSPDGRLLDRNPPRFSNWLWEDPDQFREFFGDDVDPVRHGLHQAEKVIVPMVEYQRMAGPLVRQFTPTEAKTLYLANVYHDAHEGHTGDVRAPDKNQSIYEQELEVNQEVVARILQLPEDHYFLRHLRYIMGDFEGKTFLGAAFNLGEQVGYFETGIKAWALRNHLGLDEDVRRQCEEMGREVCLSSSAKIATYSDRFAYPSVVLGLHRKELEEM